MKNIGSRFSQHSFAQVPEANIPRSRFDRSYNVKDTFNFDYLTPCFVEEIIPGDTMNLNVRSFARLAPQIRPIMDNMYIEFFWFFIPARIVWENWERFMGAQDDPGDSTDYLIPTITSPVGGFAVGSIYDHLGIPTGIAGLEINALPLRAINKTWNAWFRDQNLQNSIVEHTGDGPDPYTDYEMQKRAKPHDYFTSALPWPQKGDAVTMPLGSSAPVYGNVMTSSSADPSVRNDGHLWQFYNNNTGLIVDGIYARGSSGTEGGYIQKANTAPPIGTKYLNLATQGQYDTFNSQVGGPYYAQPPYADLSEATAASINLFRQAMMMQSYLELAARSGTRYVEILKGFFNVTSPDFRMQRPEFLSSGRIRINQHPVTQTSESTTENPLGNLAAFSTASSDGGSIGFSKSFVEHGYVIGFMQARGEVTYQQGVNRMWSRQTKEDFFWPQFQELGEQAILRQEIYATGNDAQDKTVFGYQERHGDYRYHPSEIRGQFRSTYSETLDVWHLAEEFGTAPTLNSTFIQSNTPIERALVVPDADYPHLLIDLGFDLLHARPMVTRPKPANLGRF